MLKRFAWKPILNALDSRRRGIRDQLDNVERTKKEIDSLREQYSAHLRNIEEEARMKIQEAVQEGRNVAKEIQDQARAASQERFEKTKESLDLEIEKARIALRNEIADLAIRVSEKVIHENLSGDKQQRKILDIIEKLEKEK